MHAAIRKHMEPGTDWPGVITHCGRVGVWHVAPLAANICVFGNRRPGPKPAVPCGAEFVGGLGAQQGKVVPKSGSSDAFSEAGVSVANE